MYYCYYCYDYIGILSITISTFITVITVQDLSSPGALVSNVRSHSALHHRKKPLSGRRFWHS